MATALAVLACGGCDSSAQFPLQSDFPLHLPVGTQPVWTKPYYDDLNQEQQRAYQKIYRLAGQLSTEPCLLGSGLSGREVQEVLEAYYSDTPEHFWIVEGMESFWMEGDKAYVRLRYLFSDPSALSQAKRQMEAALDRALANLRANMDDFTKELTLHDWLIEACAYDQEAYQAVLEGKSIEGMEASFSAWGALVKGKAACAGYARAMQLLLGAAGIPCAYLTGTGVDQETGKSFSHAWNVVTIDGERYHLDATWDDRGTWAVQDGQYLPSREGEDYVSHRYLNRTDQEMALDHRDFTPQGCQSTRDNYFIRQGLVIQKLDAAEEAVLVERLTRLGIKQEQPLLELWAGEDGRDKWNQMVHPEDGMLYRCLKAANQQIGEKVFQEDRVVTWYHEESGIMGVRALYEEQ